MSTYERNVQAILVDLAVLQIANDVAILVALGDIAKDLGLVATVGMITKQLNENRAGADHAIKNLEKVREEVRGN